MAQTCPNRLIKPGRHAFPRFQAPLDYLHYYILDRVLLYNKIYFKHEKTIFDTRNLRTDSEGY